MIKVIIGVLYIFLIFKYAEWLLDAVILKSYHCFKRITGEEPVNNMKRHKQVLYLLTPFIFVGGKVLLMGIVIIFILQFLIYYRSYRRYKNKLAMLLYEFPIWLRQLQCLLAYNTVYQALKTSQNIAPKSLRTAIEDLIVGIQQQPTSVTPYHRFMEAYDSFEVRKVMKILHRVSVTGTQDATTRLNAMILESHHWLTVSRNQKKEQLMTQVSALGLIPLTSVGLLFLLLMGLVVACLMEGG